MTMIVLLGVGLACKPRIPKKGKTPNPKEITTTNKDSLSNLEQSVEIADRSEMRAVWLTTIYGLDWPQKAVHQSSDINRQKQELVEILDRLQKNHFNTVFLQVRHRGNLIYWSDLESFASVFGNPMVMKQYAYDPLQFAIEECHKRGLACHAWIVTLPLGTDKHVNQLSERSVWKKHRSWTVKHRGEWYLNPALPETGEYISAIVSEIVGKYDVDGIHLDYIRYPEDAHLFPDKREYQATKKDLSWDAWRCANITRIVEKVYQTVHQKAPWVQISAATLGKYRQLPELPRIGWTCKESVHQDPKEWIQKGLVDFVTPMMYYKDAHFDPFLDDWKSSFPKNANIIPGLGVYRLYDQSRWQIDVISKQIDMIREKGFKGFAFYREENLRTDEKGVEKMIQEKVSFPSRNIPFFRTAPLYEASPLKPTIQKIEKRANSLHIVWDMASQQVEEVTYNLYYKKKGESSYHLIATAIERCEFDIPLTLFQEGEEVLFAVTAANRLNITGEASRPYPLKIRKA